MQRPSVSSCLVFKLLTLSLLAAPIAIAAPKVTLTEMEDRLRVEIDGELFTEYRFKGEERFFPACYPVIGPGEVPMTRRFPFEKVEGEDTDHPHHQSLWFAHSEINGHNFWAVAKYKDKMPGKQVHRSFSEIKSGEGEGYFIAETDYMTDEGQRILSDTRKYRFIAGEKAGDARSIDVTITLKATDGELTFGDQKDAGMAVRVNYELQVEKRTGDKKNEFVGGAGHLLNSEGVTDKDTWGKRARWIDNYGTVAGKPVGVAILDHPSNPRHPTHWHSRTYGLVAANIYGVRHFESLEDPKAGQMVIPAGGSETFRWRFVFHEGTPQEADIEGRFARFAKD